ncbi:MAG TPA: LLM class flavin-dependent oxidoreductase [Stellaceae bacterium]|nr:LLM class flavin-dependent oxidoreductase [Stellaceae bacterium]
MEFGIFDHLDASGASLHDYYEDRLKLAEVYDRAGFYSYHLAEHHATPLGMAPSPSVFLAAMAQRTRRLRFGPMVFALPLYHPLRLIEEICMLDQMSGGRLDMGFGRGASTIELAYFGEDAAAAQSVYAEMLDLVRAGLTQRTLSFEGRRFRYTDVPMELSPLQLPHPPIWYGLHAPESGERAARQGLNVICLDPPAASGAAIARFRAAWAARGDGAPEPKIGLGRFIVVAETDRAAEALAHRAYPRWYDSFTYLFRRHGTIPQHARPATFDVLQQIGQGVAGAPETVTAYLREQHRATGANYCVGQFAFGDLTLNETLASLGLFVERVMPALRAG